MKTVILVDDEMKLTKILQSSLEKRGYKVMTASNGSEARQRLSIEAGDVVFLDMMLPDTTGIELLKEFRFLYPNKAFVMMTAFGNVENAVAAMKIGAFDYITKPAKLDEIVVVIERAYEWLDLKQENSHLKERLQESENGRFFGGASRAMQEIVQLMGRVAATDATILLEGESGTGKSLIARTIHQMSDRKRGPFVEVNCAAIPEQLLESELFGYEKGAFTGAVAARAGKFEAAQGGTIFLDEIGEISPSLQAKLLQVTQEKSFMRLGSHTMKQVDVRVISATNRELKKMVEKGQFREDLYYRLNIVDIRVPSLRERKEDIPMMLKYFMERHRKKNQRNYQLPPELVKWLMEYGWPGNVREMENAVERAVVLCRDVMLSLDDFPREVREFVWRETRAEEPIQVEQKQGQALPDRLDELERSMIINALRGSGGQAASAARNLGISRQSLLYKINKYGIRFQE
jgi:DNA-binding NtrC family response regulator